MFLEPTPRATGDKFWESKQSSVVLFLFLKQHHLAWHWGAIRKNPVLCQEPSDSDTVYSLPAFHLPFRAVPQQLSVSPGRSKYLVLQDFSFLLSKLWAPSCGAVCAGHLHFFFLSCLFIYSPFPTLRCFCAQVSQACFCVEQEYLCWIIHAYLAEMSEGEEKIHPYATIPLTSLRYNLIYRKF